MKRTQNRDVGAQLFLQTSWTDLENLCQTVLPKAFCNSREPWIVKVASVSGEEESVIRREFERETGNLLERSYKILARRGVSVVGSENFISSVCCLNYACKYGTADDVIHFLSLRRERSLSPYNIQDIYESMSEEEIAKIFQAFIRKFDGQVALFDDQAKFNIAVAAFEFNLRGLKNNLMDRYKIIIGMYIQARRQAEYADTIKYHDFQAEAGKLMYLLTHEYDSTKKELFSNHHQYETRNLIIKYYYGIDDVNIESFNKTQFDALDMIYLYILDCMKILDTYWNNKTYSWKSLEIFLGYMLTQGYFDIIVQILSRPRPVPRVSDDLPMPWTDIDGSYFDYYLYYGIEKLIDSISLDRGRYTIRLTTKWELRFEEGKVRKTGLRAILDQKISE